MAEDLVGQMQAGHAFAANLAVFKTARQMSQTLLDLKADATPLHFPTIASPQADERRGFPTANAAAAWLKSKHGRWSQRHTYTNAAGEPLGIVLRWDSTDAGGVRRKHFAPVWRFADSWRITCPPSGRPLYALSELGSHGRVFVVEGEKCADILHRIGVCATTSSFGARSAFKSCWEPLAGREACLLPDADEGGHTYAFEVKGLIEALTPSARVRIGRVALEPLLSAFAEPRSVEEGIARTGQDARVFPLGTAAVRAAITDAISLGLLTEC
jgi:hypothetical protein